MSATAGFPGHVIQHLLLGMALPLILSQLGPIRFLLRRLPHTQARRLARFLRRRPIRLLTEPAVAAVLDVGGLWLIYATPVFGWSERSEIGHLVVHLHMIIAGYLFAVSVIGVDPMPHRRPWTHRAVVLVLTSAAHAVLAKYLYARPPTGVPADQAELGSMIMYYGGDLIEVAMLVILCTRFTASTRSVRRRATRPHAAVSRPWA